MFRYTLGTASCSAEQTLRNAVLPELRGTRVPAQHSTRSIPTAFRNGLPQARFAGQKGRTHCSRERQHDTVAHGTDLLLELDGPRLSKPRQASVLSMTQLPNGLRLLNVHARGIDPQQWPARSLCRLCLRYTSQSSATASALLREASGRLDAAKHPSHSPLRLPSARLRAACALFSSAAIAGFICWSGIWGRRFPAALTRPPQAACPQTRHAVSKSR